MWFEKVTNTFWLILSVFYNYRYRIIIFCKNFNPLYPHINNSSSLHLLYILPATLVQWIFLLIKSVFVLMTFKVCLHGDTAGRNYMPVPHAWVYIYIPDHRQKDRCYIPQKHCLEEAVPSTCKASLGQHS